MGRDDTTPENRRSPECNRVGPDSRAPPCQRVSSGFNPAFAKLYKKWEKPILPPIPSLIMNLKYATVAHLKEA